MEDKSIKMPITTKITRRTSEISQKVQSIRDLRGSIKVDTVQDLDAILEQARTARAYAISTSHISSEPCSS